MALQSLGLRPGDEVLTTDHCYGAVVLSVHRECGRTGASSRVLPVPLGATDEEIVETVRTGLRPGRTRLLVVDQISSATARLFPVAAIVGVAREQGVPVLVDAAHVPGMLPVGVESIGADFWVGNLHKWGYAPRGTALLAVRPPWRDRIEPLTVSWEQESGYPARVEWQATLDYTGWLAAPVGLYTLRGLGVQRVREHNAALAAYGQRVVGDALGVAPTHLPDPGGPGVAMRLVPLPPGTAATFEGAKALRDRIADRLATEVAVAAWGGRGWLRLCGQVYNSAEEYERRRCACRPCSPSADPSAPQHDLSAPPDPQHDRPTPVRPAARPVGRTGEGQQPHRDRPEQGERVEVLLAPAQAPVQAGRCRAAGVPRRQFPQRCAGGDPGADPHRRAHRLVGGAQSLGVSHGDHRSTGDHAREEHHSGTRRTDPGVGRGGQVDAPVTGQPRLGRWIEVADRRGRRVQRPPEDRPGGRPCRVGRRQRYGCHRSRRPADRMGRRSGRWENGQRQRRHRSHQRDPVRHASPSRHGCHARSVPGPAGRRHRRGGHLWTARRPVDGHPRRPTICYGRPPEQHRSGLSRLAR